MSFLNIIKRGAGAVAHGVTGAAKEVGTSMKQALTPPVEAAPAPSAEPQDRVSKGFTLPDIDPADPDAVEKQMVHDAFIALDKHWSEANPDVDYEGHYRKLADEMKNAPKERQWNPLSKFAIALGTQNPNNPWAPNEGLAKMEEVAGKKLAEEKSAFEENMALRKEALSGHIRQLLDQGKFRQALGQLELQSQMSITGRRKEHEFRESGLKAAGDIKLQAAKIAADSAMKRAELRAKYVQSQSAKLKLSPSDAAHMAAEYHTAGARLADIKKQWAEGTLSDEQVQLAEEENRQELTRIHNFYEDRELGERGPEAGPRKPTAKPAAGMTPNSADPWFSGPTK